MLLVKASFEVAKQYEHSSVITKIGNKKHQCYFKLYCDDLDIDDCLKLARTSKNIIMLEYQGSLPTLGMKDLSGVYVTRAFDFGMDVNETDIEGVFELLPKGVTAVIKLPQGYTDMRFIYSMSQKYKDIRFCGGTTFCFEGCNVGCCGRDILEKYNIKYDKSEYIHEGCACAAETVLAEEVELEVGKVHKTSQSTKKSAPSKKKVLFQDLLYQSGRLEL